MQRHTTALALHEAWLNLVARQPGRARPNDRLHRLRALSRELHRIFGAAIATAGRADRGPQAAAQARAIAAAVADPPDVPANDALYKPLAYITAREMVAMSLRWSSTPMRIAMRVAVAALIAGGIGALMGLDRAYWAIATAVLMLYQGLDLTRAMQRGLERTLGTFAPVLPSGPGDRVFTTWGQQAMFASLVIEGGQPAAVDSKGYMGKGGNILVTPNTSLYLYQTFVNFGNAKWEGGGIYVALTAAAKEVVMLYGSEIQLLPGKAIASILGEEGAAGFSFADYMKAGVAETELKLGLV